MNLHPDIAAYLVQAMADLPPPPPEVTVETGRAAHRQMAAMLGPGRTIGPVRDFVVEGPAAPIPCRLYLPKGDGPFPLFVFLHGGGFLGGDLDTHEVLCRELAHGTPCAVVAVDYRLAPEHKYPAALDDAVAAIEHCLDHGDSLGIDPSRIAVGGDSAGGNLTAAAILRLKARGDTRVVFQVLVYPLTDLRLAQLPLGDLAASPGLSAADVAQCVGLYLNSPKDTLDPFASPLLADDLTGLPPALVLTAEYDMVRNDGEAYALALARSGVRVQVRRHLGTVHGFLSLPPSLAPTAVAIAEICAGLNAAFITSSRANTLEKASS